MVKNLAKYFPGLIFYPRNRKLGHPRNSEEAEIIRYHALPHFLFSQLFTMIVAHCVEKKTLTKKRRGKARSLLRQN